MQWGVASNVLYAQEITKTDLCLGKHNSLKNRIKDSRGEGNDSHS